VSRKSSALQIKALYRKLTQAVAAQVGEKNEGASCDAIVNRTSELSAERLGLYSCLRLLSDISTRQL
jgi:hypothetical protein